MSQNPNTNSWDSAIETLVIPVGEPETEITAHAITNAGEMTSVGQQMRLEIDWFTGLCLTGNARAFGLHQEEKLIAVTVILSESGVWTHHDTRGPRSRRAPPEIEEAGRVVARAYQTAEDTDGPDPDDLNALSPQPLPSMRNPSIRRAAELYRSALESPPQERAALWPKAIEAALEGATNPGDETGVHELAFAWQMAVNAAVIAKEYDQAADLVSRTRSAGQQALNVRAALDRPREQ